VWILSWQHTRDAQAVRQNGGHVLAAVDGEVDVVAEQRVFDFLHEEPLASCFGKRSLLQLIPGGLDDDDAARRRAVRRQSFGNRIGLPQRELAAASADAEFH
jgi:hypothetical protein